MEKEAVILAGGFGTRLQSVVSEVPKPMAPVNGRPFLSFVLDELEAFQYTHVVLSTGYKHEVIASYYGEHYRSIRLSYAQETTPLGTGGGIWNALQQTESEYTLVLNGDTLFRVNLDALSDLAQRWQSPVMALRQVTDTTRYGKVETDDTGRVVCFVEKNDCAGPGYINGGIYLLPRKIFKTYRVGERFSFEKDIMEKNYREQAFYTLASDAYFIDIGIPEDYQKAQKELFDSKK